MIQGPPRPVAPPASGIPQLPAHTGPLTALQLADRILAKAGGTGGTDRIVAGDPLTAVTGIATAAMATLEVLHAAVAARANLLVVHEPAFWATGDLLDRVEGDPLFAAKRDFIRAHGLVILNLHDRWESGIADGMAKALGWEAYRDAAGFALPATSLVGLARTLGQSLDDRTVRVVGDPALPVRRVTAVWGNGTQAAMIAALQRPADVVVCGYTREWEGVEYAQDLIATGARKGLILLGQNKAVEGGMRWCAEWVRGFTPEVPVTFLATPEPYWNPRRPVTPPRLA
jgi:putative NIF3 family GTP cyclohydrolase 1 type 2